MWAEWLFPVIMWGGWCFLAYAGIKGYAHWHNTQMNLLEDIVWLIFLACYTLALSILFLVVVEATI